jgi:hypothetical protein
MSLTDKARHPGINVTGIEDMLWRGERLLHERIIIN